jgi:hypothetical protein
MGARREVGNAALLAFRSPYEFAARCERRAIRLAQRRGQRVQDRFAQRMVVVARAEAEQLQCGFRHAREVPRDACDGTNALRLDCTVCGDLDDDADLAPTTERNDCKPTHIVAACVGGAIVERIIDRHIERDANEWHELGCRDAMTNQCRVVRANSNKPRKKPVAKGKTGNSTVCG